MPIRIFSVPAADFQYALHCMDISDLIAFSLCSMRTKSLVKSSNRKIDPISAQIDENIIQLKINRKLQFVLREDYSSIELHLRDGIQIWRKPGFTQCHWIAHFLSISRSSIISELRISNICPIPYLDTVKSIIPKSDTLVISENCSLELTKSAVLKLGSIARLVKVDNNPFNNTNHHISEFLTLNLNYLIFNTWRSRFNLQLSDLLMANCKYLTIDSAVITERDLNRFLKLWMKGNHTFYRLKMIELFFQWDQMNYEDVLRGIKFQIVDHKRRLTRADGKELLVTVGSNFVVLEFLVFEDLRISIY
ncbi:unnamed protein product [Caenorhabditis nigoni]